MSIFFLPVGTFVALHNRRNSLRRKFHIFHFDCDIDENCINLFYLSYFYQNTRTRTYELIEITCEYKKTNLRKCSP
jgi:hypothetical protein